MSRTWQKYKSFWSAEEVPRLIGLLLVAVYLVALAVVSVSSHVRLQRFGRSQVIDAKSDALTSLADAVEAAPAMPTERSQVLLKRFAGKHDCRELKIYDRDGKVLASLSAADVGKPLSARAAGLSTTPTETRSALLASDDNASEHGAGSLLVARAPLAASGVPPSQFIEGVFSVEMPTALSSPLHFWMLLNVLVCTGAFFLVYRRMRQHFRSYARIADKLVHNADQLREQVAELRVEDAGDEVGECWNKLIDLTSSLSDEVGRSMASSELLAALSNSSAGELAEAMTSVPIGVVLANRHGSVTYGNAMANRLIGWRKDKESVPTLSDESLTEDGQKVAAFIRSCMQEQEFLRPLSTQIEGGDGSFYHLQVVPARTQHSECFVAVILDVSQQVRADKAREEFVSQVTHELRTPLTNIRAYAETLSSGMFDDPQVITECYNVITKETRRLSRLIEDILSISQLEVGTLQLVVDDVDLRGLLTESVRDVRGISESKNIDLQLDLPPKLEPIRADRDKLAVVVNNLLGNAIKYTPAGGQVALSCRAADGVIHVSVRDTGIGIDVKDHGRIFEKFQRADDEAVQNETGTGIGLTTAREIAQQHGGDITMVSKKGDGATFTITLPARQRSTATVEAGS